MFSFQPVPEDDEDMKALVQIENKIEKHTKLLSDITHELDGIHRVSRIDPDKKGLMNFCITLYKA